MTSPRRGRLWEDLLHRAGEEDKLLLLDGAEGPLGETRGQRAIGVVYHPEYEHLGNYVPTGPPAALRRPALHRRDPGPPPAAGAPRAARGDPRVVPVGSVRRGFCTMIRTKLRRRAISHTRRTP